MQARVYSYILILIGLFLIYISSGLNIISAAGVGFILLAIPQFLTMTIDTEKDSNDREMFVYTTNLKMRCPKCYKMAKVKFKNHRSYHYSNEFHCGFCGLGKTISLGFVDNLIFYSIAFIFPLIVLVEVIPHVSELFTVKTFVMAILTVILFCWKLPNEYFKFKLRRSLLRDAKITP